MSGVAEWLASASPPLSIPPHLRTAATVDELYPEILRLAREDLDRAADLARAVLDVARDVGAPVVTGQALRATAHVQYLQSRYAEAASLYREAIGQFRRAGGSSAAQEIARTQSSAIQTLAYLARYDEAIAWGEEARAVFEAGGDRVRLARLDGNLANLYFRLDRFDEASARYERAREEFERSGAPQDIAAVLSNLATCYVSVGRFRDALSMHTAARTHCVAHGFALLVAQTDYNIAYLHFLRGDHREALRLYAAARIHSADAGDGYHAALCDLDQAEMMLGLNLPRDAGRLARLAIEGFDRLSMRYERAKAGVFLAGSLAASHEGAEAERVFREARALFRREGNAVWPAVVDLHLAALDLEAGALWRASRRAHRALRLFSARSLPGRSALAALVLARIRLLQQRAREAESLCLQALRDAEAMASPTLAFQCRFLLGQAREALRRRREALAAYTGARRDLDRVRVHVPEEEMRIRFLADKASLYERLVPLHLEEEGGTAGLRAAWICVQQGKSRTFVDACLERVAPYGLTGQDAGEDLLDARAHLQRCHTRKADAELRGLDGEARRWQSEARAAEARVQDALAQARLLEGGRIPPLPRGESGNSLPIAEVAGALAAGEALVEYFCTPQFVYAFLLGRRRGLSVHRLAPTGAVRAAVRYFHFQLSAYQLRRGPEPGDEAPAAPLAAHLKTLGEYLIDPLRPHIDAESLVLAPHSFLHGLPFAAIGPPGRPLVADFALRQTMSGAAFAASAPGTTACGAGRPLILGLPDERAPLIATEVERVAAHLAPSDLRTGPDATLAALRDAGSSAPIVHIASHGLFRSDNPMFSAIHLADGPLNLLDLYGLRLPARLVTLSGCSTGAHTVMGGDELIGLSRGFLYAGARNLLVSLWDVRDASTARFMDLFYGHVAAGVSLDRAMAVTMRSVREESPHPYYWAGFTLMGTGSRDGPGVNFPRS